MNYVNECIIDLLALADRWSIVLYVVSVRPSVRKTNTLYNARVAAQKNKNTLHGPGGSLIGFFVFNSFKT